MTVNGPTELLGILLLTTVSQLQGPNGWNKPKVSQQTSTTVEEQRKVYFIF
jgi:hypothetical protein